MNDTYVISLDTTPERLAEFKKNNAWLAFNTFSATNGKNINKDTLIDSGLLDENCNYSAGAIGCALSHVRLWDLAIKQNKTINIFEDDAIVHPSFLHKSYEITEGKDLVVWGWNFDAPITVKVSDGLGAATIISDHTRLPTGYTTYLNENINPSLLNLISSFGTLGYSISPRAASYLLAKILPISSEACNIPNIGVINNIGIDISLSQHYQLIGTVVTVPPLAISLNQKSISTVNPGK